MAVGTLCRAACRAIRHIGVLANAQNQRVVCARVVVVTNRRVALRCVIGDATGLIGGSAKIGGAWIVGTTAHPIGVESCVALAREGRPIACAHGLICAHTWIGQTRIHRAVTGAVIVVAGGLVAGFAGTARIASITSANDDAARVVTGAALVARVGKARFIYDTGASVVMVPSIAEAFVINTSDAADRTIGHRAWIGNAEVLRAPARTIGVIATHGITLLTVWSRPAVLTRAAHAAGVLAAGSSTSTSCR